MEQDFKIYLLSRSVWSDGAGFAENIFVVQECLVWWSRILKYICCPGVFGLVEQDLKIYLLSRSVWSGGAGFKDIFVVQECLV